MIAFFLFNKLGRQLLFYAILAAAIAAFIFYFINKEQAIGAAKVQSKIETQDKDAANAADAAEKRVRACFDAGGLLDTAGRCTGP